MARLPLPDRPVLDKEEVRRLIEAAHQGDRAARDRLIEANLRLVASVVRRFEGRGADSDDLFQVGCVALMHAVDRFDLSYDVAFSTYAVPVIVGEIRRHLMTNRPVKVARGLLELGEQAEAASARLGQTLGRSPTVKEIAEAIGADPADVVAALDAVRPPASLDEPLRDEGGRPAALMDRIGVEDEEELRIESVALAQLLAALTREERRFVCARFVLGLSQTELAARIGCSQAHVSRMEKRILARIRLLWEG